MEKSRLSILIDSLFISFVISTLCFIWCRKISKNAFFCYFVCISMLVLSFILIFCKKYKKYKSQKVIGEDKKLLKQCYENIIYLSQKDTALFYSKILNATKVSLNIYKNEFSFFYINLKQQLSPTDFFEATNFYIETNKTLPLTFLGKSYSGDFLKLIQESKFDFNFYNETEIFEIIKSSDGLSMLTNSINQQPKNNYFKNLKNKFSSSLTKTKFKDLFISGLSLSTVSIFVPHSIYYLIVGSFLLILSIVCLFSKNTIPQKPNKPSLISLTQKKDVRKN